MRLIRDLWETSGRRTLLAACLITLTAVGQAVAAAVAGPVLVHRSGSLFALLALALLVSVACDLALGLVTAGLTADWSADVRRRLCRIALGQNLPTLETTPVGELLDRIDGDVGQVAGELRGSGVRLAQSAVAAAVAIVTALVVWFPAGCGMLLLTILLVILLAGPIKKIAPARVLEEAAWSDVAAVMEESIHGQDDVRTSLAQPYVLRMYASKASLALAKGRAVWTRSATVSTIASGATRIGVALVVIAGGVALATDRIEAGRLTSIWLLALAFGITIDHLGRTIPELQYALGAWDRVRQLAASPQEPAGGVAPTEADLTIRALTFRYPEPSRADEPTSARPPVLRDINLTFARGHSYALIGRTGSGKSTLAKILTRSVEVPRGTVFLGDTDLKDLDLDLLRQWIAVVPQRTEILAGTLAENIALFDPELLSLVPSALAELGLTAWVDSLPDGEATRLGDGGYALSAGQEQLVAFARVLVRDPRVVVLDEATARMDPVTETWVRDATERLLQGRIGVIIAHRLSSVSRCDQIVVLADGQVIETGPLRESSRFARLLATSGQTDSTKNPAGENENRPAQPPAAPASVAPAKTDPPPLPDQATARTFRELLRLATNDPRYGLTAVALFGVMVLLGLDGAVLPWLWADLIDGSGSLLQPAALLVFLLVLTAPTWYFAGTWYPQWWVRQMLRISLRLIYGQTGPKRVSSHTPAEVVAQSGDTERIVILADNLVDQTISIVLIIGMTATTQSIVPALFFAGTMAMSALAAAGFGRKLERAARTTVAARAAFATGLVSAIGAARTVKLAAATEPVLAHLARLDAHRSDRLRWEIAVQVWAKSTPALASGLLPLGAWALYLAGELSAGATLVAVSTLGAARWFAWTTASLVSQLPSARVWTRRTVAMCGVAEYSAVVPGVDLVAGTAPAPQLPPRRPLRRLDLSGFTAVHEDGTVGVSDLDLTVERGQLTLVVGPVGSGKSSLLRALAGIVHHTGSVRWNGELVTQPEMFLRPNQVAYVAQLPKVLSGTVADNIRLGHDLDPAAAVATAQLEHDLSGDGGGLGLLIGHKGTLLSGGQLQRLALARALAPRTELLVADDVSSALDVTTELELWRALRENGTTVVGSTSKRAALNQADQVLVLVSGKVADRGAWEDLAERWDHLAG